MFYFGVAVSFCNYAIKVKKKKTRQNVINIVFLGGQFSSLGEFLPACVVTWP